MGYTTWFEGSMKFDKPVDEKLKTFINTFAERRHMQRDVEILKEIDPDWKDHCFNGDLGNEACNYIKPDDHEYGQSKDDSIIEYNTPPDECPGLWCDWIINDDNELVWNGAEKFYSYIDWLYYLIENYIRPSGYNLNGEIYWQGEGFDDEGVIVCKNNDIYIGTN